MSKKIKLENRDTLKGYFRNGSRPNEENFESLIDSTINKLEDGISKDLDNGLLLAPVGETSDRTISFVNRIGSEHPDWSISLQKGDSSGLAIVKPTGDDEKDEIKMFFHDNGNIGINTENPKTHLDVHGVMGIQSRVGTYKIGTVPANGKWQNVTEDLYGCHAFEVIAQAGGEEGEGKYALLHATALATHGQLVNRIRRTQAFFGWWYWNKLAIRWKREKITVSDLKNEDNRSKYNYKYRLQLKTRSNYGKDIYIKYHITKLWDNEVMSLIDTTQKSE